MNILNFLSVPDKNIKNKSEDFFYHNIIANFSSGGTGFLIVVS